jgi:hypothetical protein
MKFRNPAKCPWMAATDFPVPIQRRNSTPCSQRFLPAVVSILNRARGEDTPWSVNLLVAFGCLLEFQLKRDGYQASTRIPLGIGSPTEYRKNSTERRTTTRRPSDFYLISDGYLISSTAR